MSGNFVDKEEYSNHKKNCSTSFESIEAQLATLNLAMFGDKDTKNAGMLDMVQEMHDIFKAGGTTFKVIKYTGIFVSFMVALILAMMKLFKTF